jgi:hypothetical protein
MMLRVFMGNLAPCGKVKREDAVVHLPYRARLLTNAGHQADGKCKRGGIAGGH